MNISIRNSLITYGMSFIEINKTLGNEITNLDVNKALLSLTADETRKKGRVTDELLSASKLLEKFV